MEEGGMDTDPRQRPATMTPKRNKVMASQVVKETVALLEVSVEKQLMVRQDRGMNYRKQV